METLSCWVLRGGLYGGDLGLENVREPVFWRMQLKKTQRAVDTEKRCVPGVRAIKAKQAGVPAYQSPTAI